MEKGPKPSARESVRKPEIVNKIIQKLYPHFEAIDGFINSYNQMRSDETVVNAAVDAAVRVLLYDRKDQVLRDVDELMKMIPAEKTFKDAENLTKAMRTTILTTVCSMMILKVGLQIGVLGETILRLEESGREAVREGGQIEPVTDAQKRKKGKFSAPTGEKFQVLPSNKELHARCAIYELLTKLLKRVKKCVTTYNPTTRYEDLVNLGTEKEKTRKRRLS